MKSWFVVYTKARNELIARHQLVKQGFVVYLPQLRQTIRHAGRISQQLAPLFPRYMFVELDVVAQPWRSINGTIGVVNILCDGDTPIRVPDEVIEGIVAMEDEDGVVEPPVSYRQGAPVRVANGPMRDLEGVFQSGDAQNRVTVLLKMMGNWVRVQLHGANVTAA